MKEFMLIFLGADYAELGLSPEAMQQQMGKWWAWNDDMQKQGVVIDGHPLHPAVRHVSGPDRTVTDRTSAEVKELVGGYYLIKARDLDHATEIAQGFPDYDLGGTVEIREIMVIER